jgi:hypothetical protein
MLVAGLGPFNVGGGPPSRDDQATGHDHKTPVLNTIEIVSGVIRRH